MSRRLLLASVACLSVSACGRTSAIPDRPDTASRQAQDVVTVTGDFVIGEPLRHGNLTVFPVLSNSPRTEDRFITLNEGLKAGTVEICEMGARAALIRREDGAEQNVTNQSASEPGSDGITIEESVDTNAEQLDEGDDVNRLLVINRSTKPLYLMPGEVIVGGSQDRAIADEMVIAATGEPVPINVYCVEQGRWGARDEAVSAAVFDEVAVESAAAEALAATANSGKFVAQAGNLSKSSRLAVQAGAGQQKVWEEVAKANDASGVTWFSGAFTANYADKQVLERMQPYLDALSGPMSNQERVVGVVVAINGKIETVDVFEATPLFRKLWPHILKSISLDALDAVDADDAELTCTRAEAAEFLASLQRDQNAESDKVEGGLVVSRHETKDSVSFSAGFGAMGGGMGMGGMGMGGFGGSIHSSGYSK